MKKIWLNSISSLVVGIIAAVLVIIDSGISRFFVVGASFVWVSFVSWTVFFGASIKERIIAIPGYIIGYLSANAIVIIGNQMSKYIDVKILSTTVAAILAVFVINGIVMYFNKAEKIYLNSIPGIFVGIAMTFSGAGQKLQVNDLTLLYIILVYGILGIAAGYFTNYFVNKLNKKSNINKGENK